MKIFLTRYCIGGGTYGEHIEAKSRSDARRLAGLRGLGEKIMGEPEDPSILANNLMSHIKAAEWLKAAHAATQLCFVGMAAGALTHRECLGDAGLVHEIIHIAIGADADEPKALAKRIKHVKAMATEFEWRVPGWPASFDGMPGVKIIVHEKHGRKAPYG